MENKFSTFPDTTFPMTEKEFETYWAQNRATILNGDASYKKAKESYKISSGADWLLYAIPVIAGIVFMDWCPITHELLKWLLSAVVTIVCFALCVWVKSLTSGEASPEEVEKRIKQRLHDKMVV